MAKLLKANGEHVDYNDFTLEAMQAAVGGYIQIVHSQFEDICFVMDEDGKFKGKEINIDATISARAHKAIFENDVIVGDVIICNRNDID